MKRTLNTTINRSKNEKKDEFYTQYTSIFNLCDTAPLCETTPSYDIDGNRISPVRCKARAATLSDLSN